MEVRQGKCRIALFPNEETDLETGGLWPCIGVAFIHKHRGFLLHADVASPRDTECFYKAIGKFLTARERQRIRPILTGGELGDVIDERKANLNHRQEHTDFVQSVGLGAPQLRWASRDNSNNLRLDLEHEVVTLETIDVQTTEIVASETFPFYGR